MRKIYILFLLVVLILTLNKISIAQTHFSPIYGNINPPGHFNFNLLEAKVNGNDLIAGDEIGLFDGQICVGVVLLTEGLGAWNDMYIKPGIAGVDDPDTPAKDGFKNGNPISVKFWDASEGEEITSVDIIYYNMKESTVISPVPFYDGNSAFVSVLGTHNYKPVANAGADFSMDEKGTGELDGSGSVDPENLALTYLWEDIDGFGLTDFTSQKPAITAPSVSADATYRFTLTVNDGERDSEPVTVVVTVVDVPFPPVAKAGTDFEVIEGEDGQLDGSASNDPEALGITYSWEIQPADFTLDDATSATPSFTAPTVTDDTEYLAILTVTNTVLLSAKDTVIVTIKDFNRKPVAVAGEGQQVDEGVIVTLDASGSSDPDDGDVITYMWIAPDGITFDGDNTNPIVTFTSPSIVEDFIDYEFKLVVNDGKLDSDTASVVVRVIHENIAPLADAGDDVSVDENTLVQLDGSGSSDFENKPMTFVWTAPAGVALDDPTSATPSFTAPEVHLDTDLVFSLTVNDGVWTSAPDQVTVTVIHINKPPLADAGEDQTVDEGSLVQLDATGSADLDELDVLTYTWTSIDGAVLNDNSLVSPSFTAPEPPVLMKDSTFRFVLVVNDGIVNSEPDTVSVLVLHTNLQPTADAGVDFSIDENTQGQLDGSGSSDPENAPLTYLWTAPEGFVIDDPAAESPTFTAPDLEEDTDFIITLMVDDGEDVNNTATDIIVVTVKNINKPPLADAGSDFSIREQKEATLDGTASTDPDAMDIITFNWTAPAGITLDDATSPTPTFTAPDVSVDTEYVFTLEVTDGSAEINDATVTVTVTANKAPVADAGDNQTVNAGQIVTLHAEGSTDPDDDELIYLWTAPAGLTLTGETTANPTFIAPTNEYSETFLFELEVSDDLGASSTAAVSVEVISNLPPVIVSAEEVYVWAGESVTLDASESSDPNGDILNFTWTQYNSAFRDKVILINPNDPQVSFVAPEVDELTLMPIRLKVSDGQENSILIIRVYVQPRLNTAPLAHAGEDLVVNERESGMLDGTASSDANGDPLTYLWNSEYLTLDDVTSATPAFVAPEVHADTTVWVSLVVNDGMVDSEPDSVQVTIKQVNRIPVANAGVNVTVNGGEQITFDGSGSYDPEGAVLTYSWSAEGFSITNPDQVMASLTAPEVEEDTTIPVVLVVNDGELDSQPDTIFVTVLQINRAPEFDAIEDVAADIGYGFSVNISVTDPDAMDEISIFADELPEWLVLKDNGDGTAILSTDSIPRLESLLGEHIITLKASDGAETVETSFKLNISIKVGINDFEFASLQVYPNPTSGLVNIQFNSLPEKEAKVQVFNQLGQMILFRNVEAQTTRLDLSAHPAGIYIIKVSSQSFTRTEKITLR